MQLKRAGGRQPEVSASVGRSQGAGSVIGGWAYASKVGGEVQATCFNGSAAPNYGGFSYPLRIIYIEHL